MGVVYLHSSRNKNRKVLHPPFERRLEMNKKNQPKIFCRIFKEQMDLINNLPEKDRAKVLYLAINNAFYNQLDNQDENQLDNQDANQSYLYLYHISIYESLSELSKSVLNIFYKTIEVKDYLNWGGERKGAGRKQIKSNDTERLSNDNDNKKELCQEKLNYETLFFDFWQNYIPVKCDGRFVNKGSKKISFEKFVKILKSGVKYEDIIAGTKAYINHCRENKQLTCTVPVFLNQQRWADEYNTSTIIAEDTQGKRQEPKSIVETYAEIAAKYAEEDDIY